MSKLHQSERLTSHKYEKTIQDLMEKIDILENKLRLCGKDKIRFVKAYKELEDQNEFYKIEIEKQSQTNSSLEEVKTKHLAQIATLTEQNESMLEAYRTKFDLLTRELQQKSSEIEKLLSELKEKDDKIKYITVNNSMALRFSDTYQDEIEKQKFMIEKQKKQIHQLEKEINDLLISKKSEGDLLLENEHLKDDNVRLLQMLKSTNEYHDFGYLNQTLPGGIRYVNDPPIAKKAHRDCERRKRENEFKKNNTNWIPSEAFDIVLDYKKKFNLDMNDKLINDMLASLNKVWKEREAKQITRIKAKYQKELIDLQRKGGIVKSQIEESKKAKADEYSKEIIDNVKKIASKFNDTKKGLEKTIDTLKTQLTEKEGRKTLGNVDITKTNELIVNKALFEIQQVEIQFEELLNEYKERVKDTETMIKGTDNPIFNIKMINNSVKWLIGSVREVLAETKKRFEVWKNEYDRK